MNSSRINRQGTQNSVNYSRFGLPGDEADDRPPPTQICVAPFDEKNSANFLCRKIHVAKAAEFCAFLGMSTTVCIFLFACYDAGWGSRQFGFHKCPFTKLLAFLIIGILIHSKVLVGVEKGHPKHLLPFIVVYIMMVTAEGVMCYFGIREIVTKSMKIDHEDIIIFALFIVQGSMLWIVLRCRQFLERKRIHGIEMGVAKKSKRQHPSIKIARARPGEFALSAADAVNVESGIVNLNHQSETATLPLQAPPTYAPPTHRIGVNESIGMPPPSYESSVDSHHHEQPSGGSSAAN